MSESGGSHRRPPALSTGFDRWMYQGGCPNFLARLVNWITAAQYATGLIQRHRLATLEVLGRRTGRAPVPISR